MNHLGNKVTNKYTPDIYAPNKTQRKLFQSNKKDNFMNKTASMRTNHNISQDSILSERVINHCLS